MRLIAFFHSGSSMNTGNTLAGFTATTLAQQTPHAVQEHRLHTKKKSFSERDCGTPVHATFLLQASWGTLVFKMHAFIYCQYQHQHTTAESKRTTRSEAQKVVMLGQQHRSSSKACARVRACVRNALRALRWSAAQRASDRPGLFTLVIWIGVKPYFEAHLVLQPRAHHATAPVKRLVVGLQPMQRDLGVQQHLWKPARVGG